MDSFVTAMRKWNGVQFLAFPTDRPPCPATGKTELDRVLARIFAQACSKAFPTDDDKLEYLWTRRAEWIANAARWASVDEDEFPPARMLADHIYGWFCELHGAEPVRRAA
jgi:hypothetical protein